MTTPEDTPAPLDATTAERQALLAQWADRHGPDGAQRLADAHVRDAYNVTCVLDDRTQVVQAWRAIGLTVLQVADGDF